MINAVLNNILISLKPFVKYPEGSNYAELYPNTTEYLKNKLLNLALNENVISHLQNYSERSYQEIVEDLTWGNGPTIKIKDLSIYGENVWASYFPEEPNSIYLDDDLILEIENNTREISQDALGFLLGVCILHEYVHFGNEQGGIVEEEEEGLLFEIAAFGEIATYNNAEQVFLKFINN